MNIESNIKILHTQKKLQTLSGEQKVFYQIVFCFSNEGFLAQDVLQTLHERVIPQQTNVPLCFGQLEEIHLFAKELMKELGAPGVSILSHQDFNIAMESIFQKDEIRPLLEKIGTVVTPPTDHAPKKSFFSKIFK